MRRGDANMPRTAIILLLAITALVPAGYFGFPYLHRWQMFSKLDSSNPGEQQEGLLWVSQAFDQDEAVRQAVIKRLKTDNEAQFLKLQNVLDLSADWQLSQVGQTVWLRWLGFLSKDQSAVERARAAKQLGTLTNLADNKIVTDLARRLVVDKDASVRAAATTSIVQLLAVATAGTRKYEQMLHTATTDTNGAIAARAWLALAFHQPIHGYRADWRVASQGAKGAVLYAALRTNPDRPNPAIEALDDQTLAMHTRVLAAYALHFSDKPAARLALLKWIPDDLTKVADGNIDLVTTAVLSIRLNDLVRQRLKEMIAHSPIRLLSPEQQGIRLAALYRLGIQTDLESAMPIEQLAMLESKVNKGKKVRLMPGMGPSLRLAAIRQMPGSTPEMLWPLFGENASAMRDEACVLATRKLDGKAINKLIQHLLRDDKARDRQSGALLAGMTGRQAELLQDILDAENTSSSWPTRVTMLLGRAMQTGKPGPNAEAVLASKGLPRSTVLLELMMQGSGIAWDNLLGPDGESGSKVDDLLCRQRWQYVLKALLPQDAPSYWVWAPKQVRLFQLHVLRIWYLLHRKQLTHLTAVGYRNRMVHDALLPTVLTQGKIDDGKTR